MKLLKYFFVATIIMTLGTGSVLARAPRGDSPVITPTPISNPDPSPVPTPTPDPITTPGSDGGRAPRPESSIIKPTPLKPTQEEDLGADDSGDTSSVPGDGYTTGGDTSGDSEPTSAPAPTTNRSSRSSGGSVLNRTQVNTQTNELASSQGEVLGADTENDSCVILTTYMKEGLDNNLDEVKLLQTFLNVTIGANLPVTGFFGSLTKEAVNKFQLQYSDQILKPWVDLGLHSSISTPTGHVYKTTQYTINKMLCPEVEITAPILE
jgi:hypothetical protein